MGLLVDGVWKDQWYDTESTGGRLSAKIHNSETGLPLTVHQALQVKVALRQSQVATTYTYH